MDKSMDKPVRRTLVIPKELDELLESFIEKQKKHYINLSKNEVTLMALKEYIERRK